MNKKWAPISLGLTGLTLAWAAYAAEPVKTFSGENLSAPSPAPSVVPSPVPSFAPTSLLPDWNAMPGPVELPDLTLDRDGGIRLTLEKCIELAVSGAASVLKAANDVKASGAQLLQSYGQFLPNLGVSGNYGYNSGTNYLTTATPTTVVGSAVGAGYTVTSDLNVFNGLADFSGLKSSLLKKDASDLTFERAKQQIAFDIAQSFLQVVLDNKLVDISRKNLQQSQAREHLLTEQTKVGARNLSDLFRQQAQTSFDESLLLTAQNKTRTDQILFLRKLRADVAKKYHFVEPVLREGKANERFGDERELLKVGIEKRTDLKASDELADATGWDVKVSSANYLPKLDLVGTVTSGAHYLNDWSVNGADVTPAVQADLPYQLSQRNYTVSLNLSWTLFDRLLTHQNVVRARTTADNSRIDSQDLRNQVEGEVRQAYGDYKTALQQLQSSKKGLEAAQKAYEVMEGRYEVGSANFVDLLTVQSALVQAESARAQALIGFELQSRAVDLAIGE